MARLHTEVSPMEFSKIPLDFIVATPLLTTIKAHRAASETTLEFVKGLLVTEDGNGAANNKIMPNVSFHMRVKQTNPDGKDTFITREVSVPLITLVKVPSLNFDSLSVSFNYNISQIVREEDMNKQSASLEVGTKGLLKGLLSASLVGNVEHSRSVENTANRGGSLEVKIHVSEAAMPPGLEKIIRALVENIEMPIPNASTTPIPLDN